MAPFGSQLRVMLFGICALIVLVAVPPAAPAAAGATATVGATATLLATTPSRGSVVQVRTPAGSGQVVLEQRQAGGWQPIAVRHLPAGAPSQRLAFTLPKGLSAADVRVLAYRGTRFPARTAVAARRFARVEVGAGSTVLPLYDATVTDRLMALPSAVRDAAAGADQAAVESDIWQVVGNRLFFFNQYRGLQVLDLTDPRAPVRTGTLRLAAAGEQFYTLDAEGRHLALLGRSESLDRPGAASLFVLAVTDGVPALLAEVPLTGEISDSRLIGRRLYVVANTGTQGAESEVQAIDLTDPTAPRTLPALRLSGTATALQAVAGRLLVGTTEGLGWGGADQSHMHLIDLSPDNGAPVLGKRYALAGLVTDKFKMGMVGGAVVAVTQSWPQGHRETWVETFAVGGTETTPLARLELTAARDEQLHATRFDGERLYVVTFRNTDPLFVVDLADPAAPRLAGTLEVPGWSTYIEPLGERLLAVGLESGRVTVSLFDVGDAAAPTLLARLPLGAEGSWSWSEANSDEKAVGYYPESGLVMVPFVSYGPDGATKAVGVIRVDADALTADTVIEHAFDPRRGAVLGDFFVSVSGQELLVIDRTDNGSDQPVVERSLAWTTDRVVPVGDSLVQVEDGAVDDGLMRRLWADTSGTAHSWLRLSRAADPDDLLAEWDLGSGRVVGLTERDGRLFVAQWVSATAETESGAELRTWVFDLGGAPEVLPEAPLAVLSHPLTGLTAWELEVGAGQLLWTGTDTLVWHAPARPAWDGGWWFDGPLYPMSTGAAGAASTSTSSLAAVLCTITGAAGTPTAGPTVRVQTGTAGRLRSASRAFADGDFLFFSYDTGTASAKAVKPVAAAMTLYRPIPRPTVPETVNSWLRVIDLRGLANGAGAEPIVRNPVSIPGVLQSVAQVDAQGAILITSSERLGARRTSVYRTLHANAYDGVDAALLHSLATASPVGSAAAPAGATLYLATDTARPGVLGIGYNQVNGQLRQVARWDTPAPERLTLLQGHLLAATRGTLALARTEIAGALTPLATFAVSANLTLLTERAGLRPGQGLWVPAGAYGVEFRAWPAAGMQTTAHR